MKKIYLLGILVVMLSGCDHFLDRTPYDNMDEDIVFEKLEHVQGLCMECMMRYLMKIIMDAKCMLMRRQKALTFT